MSRANLLVHTIDNNLDNIDALLSASAMSSEGTDLVGQIIQEQMNKVLENAELYYLEDSLYAKNKMQVFLLEFINYLYNMIVENKFLSDYFMVSKNYREIDMNLDEEGLNKMEAILNYLLAVSITNVKSVKLTNTDRQIQIKINFEKMEEQGLQIK